MGVVVVMVMVVPLGWRRGCRRRLMGLITKPPLASDRRDALFEVGKSAICGAASKIGAPLIVFPIALGISVCAMRVRNKENRKSNAYYLAHGVRFAASAYRRASGVAS